MISKRPVAIGAAALITAAITGATIAALTMGSNGGLPLSPQEVRIVNETSAEPTEPATEPTLTPAASPTRPTTTIGPTGTCTGGTVDCGPNGETLPRLSPPPPPTPKRPFPNPTASAPAPQR